MGVAGLWEILAPAGKNVALSKLALDAFLENKGGHRAYRVGIDASLWIFHSRVVAQTGGENPQLRTLFFKIINLLKRPLLPVFVFDGPHKPTFKRNARTSGHWGSHDRENKAFKALLDLIGLERHDAPGEAEAELAHMNRGGLIDAVLSDDVDSLLFGAKVVLRNVGEVADASMDFQLASGRDRIQQETEDPSANLSQNVGNKVPAGTAGHIYQVFTAEAIQQHFASLSDKLATADDCTNGMILVALMSGGDYLPAGLEGCGQKIAFALAQGGFHKFLAAKRLDAHYDVTTDKQDMADELQTNARGFLSSRRKVLAETLMTSSFPDNKVIHSYLHPRVSPLGEGWRGFVNHEKQRGSLEGLALACERFFEWGTKETVVRRFRSSGPYEVEAISQLRVRVLERDGVRGTKRSSSAKASSPPLSSSPVRAVASSSAVPARSGNITSFFSQSASRAAAPKPKPDTSTAASTKAFIIANITSIRTHASTDSQLEYRIEFSPAEMIRRVRDGMQGARRKLDNAEREQLGLKPTAVLPEEDGDAEAKDVDPEALLRVWAPHRLVELGAPEAIVAYEKAQREKELRKTPKKTPRKEVKVKTPRKATKVKPSSPTHRTIKQRDLMTSWLSQRPKSPTPLESDGEFEILAAPAPAIISKRPPPSISSSSSATSTRPVERRSRKPPSPVKARRASTSLPSSIPPRVQVIDLSLETDSDGTPIRPTAIRPRSQPIIATKVPKAATTTSPRPRRRISTPPVRYRVLSCNSDEEVIDCT